jgi:hypothetical protein
MNITDRIAEMNAFQAKEVAKFFAADYSDEADIVLPMVLDRLSEIMDETAFIEFCESI